MEYAFYEFYSNFSLHDSLENSVSEHLEWLKFQKFQWPQVSQLQLIYSVYNRKYIALFNFSDPTLFSKIGSDSKQKSHTCKEGGGTPQNFLLAFMDEL